MLNATKKNCPFFSVKKMLLVDTFPLWGEVWDSNSAWCNKNKIKTHKLYFFTKHAKCEKSCTAQHKTCKAQKDKQNRARMRERERAWWGCLESPLMACCCEYHTQLLTRVASVGIVNQESISFNSQWKVNRIMIGSCQPHHSTY